MCSKVFMCLIGAAYIYLQVLAAVEDVYIAELMVESNVTLEANTFLSLLNFTTAVSNSTSHQVTISHSELVAECLIVGDESTCNCSTGYIWSNLVCYEYNCCREIPCAQNVSHFTPLCVAKVNVHINGSVILNAGGWDSTKSTELKTKFEDLNGFESLNVTGPRLEDNKVIDFEAAVSIKFPNSKLQDIVSNLELSLGAVFKVETIGLVTIEAPETPVCYKSVPVLKCTFEETTGSAGWDLIRNDQRFELSAGSVVNLDSSCATPQYNSCVTITLQKVTGIWSGLYECGFTSGSVRHTAKAPLNVTLLPDTIALTISPLTADCSKLSRVSVTVSATISNTPEIFTVLWHYNNSEHGSENITPEGDEQIYTFIADVNCEENPSQKVSISFKNTKGQIKRVDVQIPVIYAGEIFCEKDEYWPKSPAGDTVINKTCEAGRVGYKSRTCEDTGSWQDVYSYCIKEELNKLTNEADNFLKGLGSTQELALNIFSKLENISASESDSSDSIADIVASINILDVMAKASENITLQEGVLPGFIGAASNMLNNSWEAVNTSEIQKISSNYLMSVEGLVKNIEISSNRSNRSDGHFSPNLELKFCSSSNCSLSVFDIDVNLNRTAGIIKAVAIKNLMNKLENNFQITLPTSLLLLATVDKNSSSSLQITLDFPQKMLNDSVKPYCVFWNTTTEKWSDVGCVVKPSNGDRTSQVSCECSHLTSFSVLMAKEDIPNGVLEIITNVGLAVSVCSLLIFLTVEFLVWSAVVKSNLSHFRHTAMVNIATFLLLANCSFLASDEGLSESWCLFLTICKHLFYLAMFSWMLCLSVMLVHQLIFVFSPLRKRVFMLLSSIIGYVCPIIIVGSSYMYCKFTDKPYYVKKSCWLVYKKLLDGSIHAFILPVGTVILTNLFSMVVVITTLVKSSVPDASKVDDKETAKSIIKVVVFLTPIFGVTWIIGFALLLLDKDDPFYTVASYSFTILNSFQGLFLLITGCFAEQKVREEMLKLILAKSKGKSESMKNLTSTTDTKDK